MFAATFQLLNLCCKIAIQPWAMAFLILSMALAFYNLSFVHDLFLVEGTQRREWGDFGWNKCRRPSAQSRRWATDESAARKLIADALNERVVITTVLLHRSVRRLIQAWKRQILICPS
jgi:hypothetical protein